ncbi:APC family permease [Hymenobacter sp. BT175]|uniref:APC family permease n=1 Tax=Hymenobacter translucens TaxID=2886507 RepID=UPI001D0E1DE3|nr:APC family permease [Hymenobacter translucens]MCC2548165.1 APC family permease [Hymenobacter translucens]
MVGGTTGTGVLRSPGEIAAAVGAPGGVLLVWLAGGFYALLGANAIAELGAMLPQAGGWYGYAHRAFGEFTALVVAWGDWVSSCVTGALVALMMSTYIAELVPAVAGHERTVSLAAVGILGLVQWQGLRAASRAQELTSLLMGLALLALLTASWWLPAAPVAAASKLPAAATLLVAFQSVIFAYDGWYAAIYFAEEDHNPAHAVPRSMLGGVALIILIYALLNAALLHALPFGQLAGSELPLADVADRLLGSWGRRAMLLVAVLGHLGVLNSVLMMATRVLFALGRDGQLPPVLARVHGRGTPRPALLVAVGLTLLLVASGTAAQLLAITSILFVSYYAVGFAAVLRLRRTEPDLLRPYQTWGYPYTTWLVLLGSVAFLLSNAVADPGNTLWALALVAGSYPVWWLVKRRRKLSH